MNERQSAEERSATSDPILLDRPVEGVCRITLNRPDALNSFTWEMYQRLLDALADLENDATIRVVVLTGAGRGFCAGHDIRNGGQPHFAPEGAGRPYRDRASIRWLSQIPSAIRNLPQPVICAVNGAAAGLGYALALTADITIAARSAQFINAFHNAGGGAELGFSYLLPRLVGTQRAAELMLTARPVLADEAERIGLIVRAVEDERLMDEALSIASNIMVNVPLGVQLTKQSLIFNQTAGSLEMAMELEARAIQIYQSTQDAKEKRAAMLEKRRPNFTVS